MGAEDAVGPIGSIFSGVAQLLAQLLADLAH